MTDDSAKPHDTAENGDNIEITPEMIEAGADVLLYFDSLRDSHADYAELVYDAMERVRIRSFTGSSGDTILNSPLS